MSRQHLWFGLLLFGLLPATVWAQTTSDDPRIDRIENGLLPAKDNAKAQTLAERMKHYRVPGVSIAVVESGKIAWAKGYGVVEKDGIAPVTAVTLFQAASVSKPIAAIGAMKLVQEGKLDLDEDVNRKLKSWHVPENEFTKEKKVTLRGLLSHSAGLTVHGFPGYAEGKPVPTLPQILNGEKPANTAAVRVNLAPGSRWRYSGGGYTMMQLLVMDVTGKPFDQYMPEAVLTPAGMTDSTYAQPLPADRAKAAATGHRMIGSKVVGRFHTYPEQAAAGLWTTPTDLCRLALAMRDAAQGKSDKLLKQATAQQMFTMHKEPCGLGWFLRGKDAAFQFSHGGRNEGFDCMLVLYPETGQGAAVMVNSNVTGPFLKEVVDSIAREYNWPK